jgi:hypothetical protein
MRGGAGAWVARQRRNPSARTGQNECGDGRRPAEPGRGQRLGDAGEALKRAVSRELLRG